MKTFVLMFLFLCASAVCQHVRAQVACPPGWIPYSAGGGGVAACGPDPSYNQEPPSQAPQSTQSTPVWQSRWGAIATDAPHGALGVTTHMPNQQTAEIGALADCHAKGGSNCQIQVSYSNSCAALAVSDVSGGTASRISSTQAEEAAMKVCKDGGGTNCHVYYSACSAPAQIR
jgi:hypothetical protein